LLCIKNEVRPKWKWQTTCKFNRESTVQKEHMLSLPHGPSPAASE
jgi:hypothetical protein